MDTICNLLISFAEVFAAMSPWLAVGSMGYDEILAWIREHAVRASEMV